MSHNAPGKHYRKGLSMVELTKMFPDDETAEPGLSRRAGRRNRLPQVGSFDIHERKTVSRNPTTAEIAEVASQLRRTL